MSRFGFASIFVRMHIKSLPIGQIFTSREFLSFGSRAAIDQALYRLVKDGWILRLARGVFVREGAVISKITPDDVVAAKARAYGKEIACWGGSLLKELGLEETAPENPTYATSGGTSSFKFGEIRICLKRVAGRNLKLTDSIAGKVLKVLWYLGPSKVNLKVIGKCLDHCLRTPDRHEVRRSLNWVPSWLAAYLQPGYWPEQFLPHNRFPKPAPII